jgi:V/A-type H+-transporting ATPase subunit F
VLIINLVSAISDASGKYDIAVIGDRKSILAFKAFGIHTVEAQNAADAIDAITKLREAHVGVVFITEDLAKIMADWLQEWKAREELPIIIEIPTYKGSLGLGYQKMKRYVERAIGADILFKNTVRT